MTVYDRIRELRNEKGMTQDDLAKAMGYKDRSMITKIEGGKVDISQKKLADFARVLDTTPAYLMGWEDDMESVAKHNYVHVIDGNGEKIVDLVNGGKQSTKEVRIISAGVSKMPEEAQKRLLNIIRLTFEEYKDYFNDEGSSNNDT